MPIGINGNGSITGISSGGLPDASVNTEDLNAGTASSGQKLVASGASGAMTWGSSIVSGTAQNSTSGTSIDFTGIPSWAKRVTVMFTGVSTTGSSPLLIRIGAGSIDTTGYLGCGAGVSNGGTSAQNSTAGFIINGGSTGAAEVVNGLVNISLLSANTWCTFGGLGRSDGAQVYYTGGSKTLSGTLDRVRITTVGGTDTFDAGSINIFYE